MENVTNQVPICYSCSNFGASNDLTSEWCWNSSKYYDAKLSKDYAEQRLNGNKNKCKDYDKSSNRTIK